ncbi:PHD finger protein enhancer of yellow 3 isoform X1 [Bombus vancouverensis nearcticus]|uniref:PHD finger protein enhancer of yellow 3 isoform X1 n=2 Tax=Bombus vancouverensis nearcticus TaxID=2705178 RepID=UPI00402BEF60
MFNHAEIVVPAEDTKDESMEEEVNLTLKLEETESQSEIMKNDIEVDPENKKENSTEEIVKESQVEVIKNDVADEPENQQSSAFHEEIINESQPEIVTKSQLEIIKSDGKEEPETRKYATLPKETLIENEKNFVINMDDNIAHSANVETASDIEMNAEKVVKITDAEDLELNKNEELSNKQQLEDNLKCDTNKDNLKDILETASKVEDIFSEEQCQSTQDIVTSILDDVRNATDFKNILSTEAVVANEIEEVLQQSGNIPLAETEIEELTEKLPQDSEDILNKDMEDSISEHIDSLEGLLGLDLIPEGEDSSLKATKAEEELQKSDQLSKVVDMSLLLEQSDPISDMAQTSDYITQVISSCLTDRNDLPLETTKKSNTIEVVDDKVKKSPASDILKIDGSIIVESIDKDENVEDLQKDLKQVTDLEENELDIDFEEAQLESVGDLEDIESQPEIDKNDVDEESENIKNAGLSEEIVAEDQENLVINMDDNTVNATNVETASDIEIELASDILLHNMDHNDKAENVGDIQKDLKVDSDLTETELDIEFEEAHLESVGDLEEIESQAEITKSDLEEIESQAEITKGDVKETEPQEEIAESDLEEIKLQAEIANSDIKEIESQVEMPESDVEETESQTEIAKGDVEETEVQIKIAEDNVEETESQTERAEDNVEETESQAKIAEGNVEETESQTERAEDNVEETESQAEIIKGDIKETESKIKINKSNIEETETQINIAKDNVEEEPENKNNMELTEEIIIESQPEIMKSSVEEECENKKKMEFTEKIVTESQPKIMKCDIEEESENKKELPVELPIELPAKLPEKIVIEDQENLIINMDNNTVNLANVERASNIDTSNILLHNMDCYGKEEDVGDLQKVLKGDTNLTENELGMDFEGAPLESVNDLAETELQPAITKIDVEEESENRKHIELPGKIVTEPQPEVVKNADEEEHENRKGVEFSEEIITKIQENLVIDMDVNSVDLSNVERSNDIETQLTSDILLHNMGQDNKDNNFENLQKDLREGTNLDMDFEEAPLESITDLEETESQSGIVKNDIEGDSSEDRKNAGLPEAIVTEDNPAEGNLTEDNLTEDNLAEENLVTNMKDNIADFPNMERSSDIELELPSDILLPNVDHDENLDDARSAIETSQPSSEISELESAVKFLQESEEQAMDSPLVLSPKMMESVVDDISKQADASSLFVPNEDICENTSELEVELQNITTDSISISEAEIISEAAKLESERKLAEQIKIVALQDKFEIDDDKETINEGIIEGKITLSETKFGVTPLENIEIQQLRNLESNKVSDAVITLPHVSPNVLKTSESIPKVSILEERLREPPKIEIPTTDVAKVSLSPNISKDSLLIQKDAKLIAYQKMLESPKMSDKSESKIVDTPRKDSEKHDFENVGSPRIILKIAKSAITDCGEPRSPKSPKIRSATNSPNPEDSPGQKLGKIKLKLSKGGHPSIISNENIEEVGQWYSEGSSSLSPLGMKIKFSKSGDPSIVSAEKYESIDDCKEGKHKFEETVRTESPIGMKIKLSKSGDASIVQQDAKEMQIKHKDKLDMVQESPKRTESPIGMKIKLSKTGDASIIQSERQDFLEEYKDNVQIKPKEKLESCYGSPKRTDSPIGMKIKLSKSGDASIVSPDLLEENKDINKMKDKLELSPEIPKRTESPIGMKIKLAKTKGGGASIISVENSEEVKDKLEIPDIPKRTESPLGMKIKLSKTGDASIVHSEVLDEIKDKMDTVQDASKSLESSHIEVSEEEQSVETIHETLPKIDSPLGMKIKLSKFGDASIVSLEKQEQLEESPKRTESPLGMKIKLSKSGDASIIQTDTSEDANKTIRTIEAEHTKTTDASLGMKIKLLKTGDASIVDPEKKDREQRRRDAESSLEMKIKLSKTGHPTIVACDNQAEVYKSKEAVDPPQNFAQRYKEPGQIGHKEPALKILKSGNSTILQSNRSELTIEPVQMQGKKLENVIEMSPKRKDITIAPIESKKSKLETQLTQILPEVTIQPVTSREQKQFLFDPKNSAISLQQMNVINQEISITQVRPQKSTDASMNEKLKDILSKNVSGSPLNSDCEIIEHRSELIIVNENSNSSQDVVIIEEVSTNRMPEVKVPKKRGRPRRNPLPQGITHPPPHLLISRDPLPLDDAQQMQQPQVPHFPQSRENERPKRTCRSQKSYAPPRRGRGRGRGKRKLDTVDPQIMKKPRIEQDLNAIEASTTAVITIDDSGLQQESFGKSPELYKALKQPVMDSKIVNSSGKVNKKIMGQKNGGVKSANIVNNTLPDSTGMQSETNKPPEMRLPKPISNEVKDKKLADIVPERMQKTATKLESDIRSDKPMENAKLENKDMLVPPGHPNWLTPALKRTENATKHENMSMVQVIDEETRMSAESSSRSQTPARNISAPASDTIVNEESQGSVLSTATTESEKVKVKNRRMEINFDPDEGPFTVDKIAEYEWPLDRKGETFMIQEQISQYLGVKSFKRKYPDLKRRVVDMEERNYLRENGLVSEAMCDMGLTAICSSEVLDVMCSDFPDQYEEYRKHMREKQVKEHSKKQKELTAAANAEKNRIDLAEMAVQSALSWNISLNKARRENRKCSLDLQTFTIHVPKKQQEVESERRIGHYPVALIPGQYTDYYREYTPAELRYYPLNTVLYGPMRPNERKFDSQSEGSQSDTDSDSSSDDSSSSSSEGTQDTEGSQSTMDDVDMEITNRKDEIKLKCKMCLKTLNKHSKNEVLIQCGTCNGHVHPSCIDLTLDMVPHIQSYAWQCTDCKTCAQCHDPADEDKMLFCDMCDRGYHIYCVGLRRVPQGRWHCQECAVCVNCGSREPGGINSDRNSVAQWQHEYKKGDKNIRVYVSTLCVPCSKLWRKGRYCPHCSRCHTAPRLDLEVNLVHCSACDKYLHLGCVETKGMPLDRKNYLCDFCAPNRQQLVKSLISRTLRT